MGGGNEKVRTAIVYVLTVLQTQNLEPNRTNLSSTRAIPSATPCCRAAAAVAAIAVLLPLLTPPGERGMMVAMGHGLCVSFWVSGEMMKNKVGPKKVQCTLEHRPRTLSEGSPC
jgi:hypothetical protein